jgi:hypothetical protein
VENKGKDGNFGSGLPKQTMKFADFLREIDNGREDLYLTTQYENENENQIQKKKKDNNDNWRYSFHILIVLIIYLIVAE